MDTSKLKKFAQSARRNLIEQVSNKLKLVIAEDSAARRENAEAVKKLEQQIASSSKEQVIEKVAYIWFNRFCALRFMDVNRYTRMGVISPAEGQSQPEILAEAKMGHIDEKIVPEETRQQIFSLLDGSVTSNDPQAEAYRLLIVAVCNYWYSSMPFMFERIADYTELLMPDDLLSGSSVLADTREAMTADICEDVEVIGWLYQFYISEKKDEVFDGLKKNKKITPENIPAATQLFTPHWIVRYLVENSLGRLWMLNHPDSRLVEQMDYYIKPEQENAVQGAGSHAPAWEPIPDSADSDVCIPTQERGNEETDFLHISSPEEIKICDPACGSGHMLTYAFDLLYAIYEEEGYESAEIPEKILTNNLFGIEIDERAGELAAFALTMKARAKQRRFLRKKIQPNICVLENIQFEDNELNEYMAFIGRDLFTAPLLTTLRQFEEADNFGSLIRPDISDVTEILQTLQAKDVLGQLFLSETHNKVLQVLKQADYLSPKFHVVIANPPYMGGKGMNGRLGKWVKDNYPDVKSDLFSAFIVRNTEMALPKGQLGFMSPFVWMFISSYEKLRNFLINQKTITSLVQLEYSGFDGATVPICTFTLENTYHPDFKGGYVRLTDFRGAENQAPKTLEAIKNTDCGWYYHSSASDFKKIPSSPIAYWVSENELDAYSTGELISNIASPRKGMDTGENDKFLRLWSEVSISKACLDNLDHSKKWFPYNKGGGFRRWYGNREYLVNWKDNGADIKSRLNWTSKKPTIRNPSYYFKEGLSWGTISSSSFSIRYIPEGCLFDNGGCTLFAEKNLIKLSAFANSKVMSRYLEFLSPTLNFQAGDIGNVLYKKECFTLNDSSNNLISIAQVDWDSYEISWDFTSPPILQTEYCHPKLKSSYYTLRIHWQKMTLEMQHLEKENNRIFIEAYGLQDELTPEVHLKEITLTCNPHYRYGGKKSDEELEALLLADTLKEFISYAVGCMFGRYALEKPGLILANQSETIDDYYKKLSTKNTKGTKEDQKENVRDFRAVRGQPLFPADDDNVIPMLDGDWFTDDITERFFKFLRITFGDEHYAENHKFIEQAIGKDVRKYFLKYFYNDHVKRYKKRPIYWLFSSPKGSFNALIYMHRYRPDTVSVVLNDYLREFNTKLSARKQHLEAISISASASQSEKTKALKEIEKLNKMITEMEDYEREVLYPLATEQVEIDLDDGVKVNYNKFGKALKKITGLTLKKSEK